MKFETTIIHSTNSIDPLTGAVNIPIYQTATYKQDGLGQHKGYEYSRTKNPTRSVLETLIAQMEQGDAGFAFASGMAAISTVLSLFRQGDTILISDNLYGGTYRVLDKVFTKFGIQYQTVDTTDLAAVEQAFASKVDAIFLESPTNPLLDISDIAAISRIAKQHQALTIVDNTFMTPYRQKPLLLGADIVVHSATKYLGGHSDLVAGLVVTKTPQLSEQLGFLQNAIGAVLGPQDSYLLIRGIKTLAVRLDRHQENTLKLIAAMQANQNIKTIYHPSLPEHKNHAIAKSQTSGEVGIISFVVQDHVDIAKFVSSLQLIALGESLGGIESLLTHPASMTHASYPKAYREEIGIVDSLLRLSVGIEHCEDLLQDLEQALEKSIR